MLLAGKERGRLGLSYFSGSKGRGRREEAITIRHLQLGTYKDDVILPYLDVGLNKIINPGSFFRSRCPLESEIGQLNCTPSGRVNDDTECTSRIVAVAMSRKYLSSNLEMHIIFRPQTI